MELLCRLQGLSHAVSHALTLSLGDHWRLQVGVAGLQALAPGLGAVISSLAHHDEFGVTLHTAVKLFLGLILREIVLIGQVFLQKFFHFNK